MRKTCDVTLRGPKTGALGSLWRRGAATILVLDRRSKSGHVLKDTQRDKSSNSLWDKREKEFFQENILSLTAATAKGVSGKLTLYQMTFKHVRPVDRSK